MSTLKNDIDDILASHPEFDDEQLTSELAGLTTESHRMISQDMIVAFLTQFDCVSTLQGSSDEKAKGFWLAVTSGVGEFNLMNGHPVGVAQQMLLEHLVGVGALSESFRAACLAYANYQTAKYPSITLYQVKLAMDNVPHKQVQVVDAHARLSTTADCERHFPRISFYDDFVEQYITVGQFREVQTAGNYLALVPAIYRNKTLFVDDPYGVVA